MVTMLNHFEKNKMQQASFYAFICKIKKVDKYELMKGMFLLVFLFALFVVNDTVEAQDTLPKKATNVPAARKPTVVAGLLRGPYLQVATSSSIIIRWRT